MQKKKKNVIENSSMKTIIESDVPTYYYKIEKGISKVKSFYNRIKRN